MLPSDLKSRTVRPMSEVINSSRSMNEADVAGNWYEDLQKYESNLDEMASATLDQNFKEEMQHVDQWYRYLTEAEKTATMYTLLQHSTQVQARFFINLLQQMVKRDPLFSLLTANNSDQDMQHHLAGALAKAELEASQPLMSILPYKTGQVMSRPPSNRNRRTVDRHSFSLGDTEEYTRPFSSNSAVRSNNNSNNDLLNPHSVSSGRSTTSPYVNSLLDDGNNNNTTARRFVNNGNRNNNGTSGRTMFHNGGRPHSVIEGDTSLLFPLPPTIPNSSNWLNNNQRRVGPIGDRSTTTSRLEQRPKSADISHWSLPTDPPSFDNHHRRSINFQSSVWSSTQQIPELDDNDLIDFTNSLNPQSYRGSRHGHINRESTDEQQQLIKSTQDLFLGGGGGGGGGGSKTSLGIEHYSNFILTPPSQPPSYPSIVDNSHNLLAIVSSANNNASSILNNNNNNNKNTNNNENGYVSDHSDGSYMSRRRSSSMTPTNVNQIRSATSKDKKSVVDVIDMELLKDIPAWLRSLRLHKYNAIFSDSHWQTMVKMSDEDLVAKGVAALGARRKMLKVFENIRAHCDANHIEY